MTRHQSLGGIDAGHSKEWEFEEMVAKSAPTPKKRLLLSVCA